MWSKFQNSRLARWKGHLRRWCDALDEYTIFNSDLFDGPPDPKVQAILDDLWERLKKRNQ